MTAVKLPESPAAPAVTATSPTQEINLDTIPTHAPPAPPPVVEPALGLEPTSMGGAVEPQSFSSAPTIEIDTPVSANREAPPMDSFSLEGLETTSLAADAPAAAAPPPIEPPPVPASPAAEAPAEGLVDLDISIPSAEAPAPAAAAPSAPADVVDLDFAPPPAAPAPAPEPVADSIDLDCAPPAASAPPPPPAPVEPAPVAELPPLEEPAVSPTIDFIPVETPVAIAPPAPPAPVGAPAPDPELVPEPAVAASAPDSGSAFVTETMAELYLKQGHRDEALRVYRALLEKRPGDAGLQAKIASLAPPPAAVARSGPSIRELLHVIALRRPGHRPAPPSNGNGTSAHDVAVGPDGLAYLFGGVAVSPAEDAAALLLSSAFVEHDGHDTIAGMPAHQAANDLSLNTVFAGDNPAPQPPPSSFSFDRFFSQRATAEHDAQGAADEPTESREDVAQFSQWLEGLKQK
jgi:hypothetical protein